MAHAWHLWVGMMMNDTNQFENVKQRTTYQVLRSIFDGEKLVNSVEVGRAYLEEESPYYVLNLWMFPSTNFYLKKNQENIHYTVYARKVVEDGEETLLNPVGGAWLDTDLKDYLKIRFNLLDRRLFMGLYPIKEDYIFGPNDSALPEFLKGCSNE